MPDYQCFDSLDDKVIAVAVDRAGRVTGFCSALLLQVPQVGEVLHLGLTCVHPRARGHRLTHALTQRVVVGHLLRTRPLGKVWISNVACVLSSVGNVARFFDEVFPSPYGALRPSETHLRIATAIDRRFRAPIAIRPEANFDRAAFVFRGSVQGTVFAKEAGDRRYHHRDDLLNTFYSRLMRIDAGDEVLQVGRYDLSTLARYALRSKRRTPREPLVLEAA